jgi:hypothetical protein
MSEAFTIRRFAALNELEIDLISFALGVTAGTSVLLSKESKHLAFDLASELQAEKDRMERENLERAASEKLLTGELAAPTAWADSTEDGLRRALTLANATAASLADCCERWKREAGHYEGLLADLFQILEDAALEPSIIAELKKGFPKS